MLALPGAYRNFEELEEALSREELKEILEASRKRRHEEQKFLAAIQGIDLDKHTNRDTEEDYKRVQRRAQARLQGKDPNDIEASEFAAAGIEYESE